MNRLRVLASYAGARFDARARRRQDLEMWQERRMQSLLAAVLPRSPYYRERIDPRRWREGALTDKALMMRHFDRLNTVSLTKADAMAQALRAERDRHWAPTLGGLTVGLSSGSSGHRGLFVASMAEREAWAGRILAKALPGPLWEAHRIALFLRSNSNLYQSLGGGRLRFEYFDLKEDLESQMGRLRDFNPTVLAAPPSLLRHLAARGHGLRLRRLYSVAEPLEDLDRRPLERSFGLPLGQIYQATEGFLAISCSHGTLHVNEDILILQKQWLDEELGRFTPIISDFRRTSQPILRYHLDDVLSEAPGPCPCGSIFLALRAVEGRQDDLCYFFRRGQPGLRPVYADFIRQALLLADGHIRDYRVEQSSPRRLRLAIDCPPSKRRRACAAVARELKVLAAQQGFVVPQLSFGGVFRGLGTVKLRRIRRTFKV